MRVRVYREGYGNDADEWDKPPKYAAERFAIENDYEGNIIVEPLDDEARALPGWSADEDSPHFKMFRSRATTTYDVTEV